MGLIIRCLHIGRINLDDLSQSVGNRLAANNVGFYFDYQNGEYGFNTSETRGADTFSPFKKGINSLYGLVEFGQYMFIGGVSANDLFKIKYLPETNNKNATVLINSGAPNIIFNISGFSAQVYLQYTSSYGGFQIYIINNEELTSLGERANAWVSCTSDYVYITGNIAVKLQFKWV